MKITIDLLWLRPKKVGGTEFYIRNLLDGFLALDKEFEFILLVSKDNAETFKKYAKDSRFRLLETHVISANIGGRIIWQYLFQNRLLRKKGLRNCFVPVYCRPLFNGGITYINVIHDLQAYHYPEYHPLYELAYSRLSWWLDCRFSKKIVAISKWVKDDILQKYSIPEEKIKVIHNPILIHAEDMETSDLLQKKFGVKEKEYFSHKMLAGVFDFMAKQGYRLAGDIFGNHRRNFVGRGLCLLARQFVGTTRHVGPAPCGD